MIIGGRQMLFSIIKRSSPHRLRLRLQINNEIRCFSSENPSPWPRNPEELLLWKKPPKIQRKPFVKNLFLGIYDKDVLTYPEILDLKQLGTLEQMVAPVEKYFLNYVDGAKIDAESAIPDDVMKTLQSLGLFGLQIPVEYGGLGLSATEYARITEATALNGSIAVMLGGHQSIGLKGIIIAGNEKQKENYLPKLATGQHIAAFCLTEASSGSDAASIKTTATLSEDGTKYLLNGTKIYITNGGIADIFTVFAKVKDIQNDTDKFTAFIVERAFGGITNGQPEDKLGIRGSNTCEVCFENTPVPIENILGEVGDGFKVAMNILNSGRFSVGSSVAGEMRHLLKLAVDHVINRVQFNQPLKEFEIIQEKIVNISMLIYAMESMAYLTAGLIDSQEKPDCAIEAAIVKVYSSEAAFICASELLQIMGGQGYMKGLPFERVLRDSRVLSIFEGTNEILRLFIALTSLQHAGKEIADLVRKLRNPFLHPQIMFGKIWQRWKHRTHRKRYYMDLPGRVHPNFKAQADSIDYATQQLQIATEMAFQHYGTDLTNRQMFLRRLADAATDIYLMTAIVARASRSYCSGLPNCVEELKMVEIMCKDASKRITGNLEPIFQGRFSNQDNLRKDIASIIFKRKEYCFSHPLTRNV